MFVQKAGAKVVDEPTTGAKARTYVPWFRVCVLDCVHRLVHARSLLAVPTRCVLSCGLPRFSASQVTLQRYNALILNFGKKDANGRLTVVARHHAQDVLDRCALRCPFHLFVFAHDARQRWHVVHHGASTFPIMIRACDLVADTTSTEVETPASCPRRATPTRRPHAPVMRWLSIRLLRRTPMRTPCGQRLRSSSSYDALCCLCGARCRPTLWS